MSLPASARRRWGLDEGGNIGYLDLGDSLIITPGDIQTLRGTLLAAVTDKDWELARRGFGDDELITE